MRNVILSACIVLAFCAGCTKSTPELASQSTGENKPQQSPDELAKAMIASNEEIAKLLEGIKNDADFQSAQSALEKAVGHRRDLNAAFTSLHLSETDARTLEEKNPEVVATRSRVREAQLEAVSQVSSRAKLLNDLLERAGFPRAAVFRAPKIGRALQGGG
jgi:hypothetical protein